MVRILTPKLACELGRGDLVVFPPHSLASRSLGRHRKPSGLEKLEGTGQYEVCGTMLADGTVKVWVLGPDLRNYCIPMHFKASVSTVEFINA